MDILSMKDDEVYAVAKPIWDNLVKSSNLKDYGVTHVYFVIQKLVVWHMKII